MPDATDLLQRIQDPEYLKYVQQELAKKSFKSFIEYMWDTVEPGRPFIGGWHLDAIVEHLEAVKNGQIPRLLINMPPRHAKSIVTGVFWPAWCWLDQPHLKWIFASYDRTLTLRDNVQCRRVIESTKYQECIKGAWSLQKDQNAKTKYENTTNGARFATSVEGGLTGEGANHFVIDDPHNVQQAESETKRLGCLRWFDESVPSRLEDSSSLTVIMQRVKENDLTGHILSKSNAKDWTKLVLPAKYEGKVYISGFNKREDPRKEKGEYLWPARFSPKFYKDLEVNMGSYAWAGQYQQRPYPRDGGLFDRTNFQLAKEIDVSQIKRTIRYFDKAASTGPDACYTAGVRMHMMHDGTFVVSDVIRGQWTYLTREKHIKQATELDNDLFKGVITWCEQEPGSGGKESAEATVRNLAGFRVKLDRVTGDKVTRAEPYSAQVEARNITLLKRHWTEAFLEEHEKFPMGAIKDQVDASAGAFNKLCDSARKRVRYIGRR